MRNAGRLLDILDRMEHGPITEEKEFDAKLIAARSRQLVKEYGIKFDGVNLINTDDGLADRCFQAGLALAEGTGLYCVSNGRRLTWSRREILEAIQGAPPSLVIGSGHDAHQESRRSPEDARPPSVIGGPIGTPLPEDLFVPIMQSYIQEPIVDTIIDGTLETVYGRAPRSKSPWEVLAGWREAELVFEAAHRAGRPGIAIGCVQNGATDVSELSATSYGGFRPSDWHHVAMISELKTSYELLNKVAHLVRTDSIIHSFCNPILGGWAGGAEGVAVVTVAGEILLQMAYMTTTHSQCPTHSFHMCNTAPEIVWTTSMSVQALSRNTPFMLDILSSPVGGPGTATVLYETATMALSGAVSGVARLMGVRSARGVVAGHVSGLEARFMGEVGRAVAGMSRQQANEIVKQIVPKYRDWLDKEDKGKRFDEVYDVRTLKPGAEWLRIYDAVKEELLALGVPFK
jgi:methylamine--corrinoid protein Co-methyltransferase